MTHQPPLPGFDLRPLCPLCGQPAAVLGQVHPRLSYRACPACCQRYALPSEAWGAEWHDQPYAVKALYLEVETELRARLTKPPRPVVFHPPMPSAFEIRQMHLPVCSVCGKVHGRLYTQLGAPDYRDMCQSCDDDLTVRRLFESRQVWRLDETELEGELDKLYRAFPDLFARGVLPDAWFRLMVGARK